MVANKNAQAQKSRDSTRYGASITHDVVSSLLTFFTTVTNWLGVSWVRL